MPLRTVCKDRAPLLTHGGVLVEEADELGGGIWSAGVGVGLVRDTAGPVVSALVDGPAFGQGRAGGVVVTGAGVGVPAGDLPAAGHAGGPGTGGGGQGVVDEGGGVGGGHGRVL